MDYKQHRGEEHGHLPGERERDSGQVGDVLLRHLFLVLFRKLTLQMPPDAERPRLHVEFLEHVRIGWLVTEGRNHAADHAGTERIAKLHELVHLRPQDPLYNRGRHADQRADRRTHTIEAPPVEPQQIGHQEGTAQSHHQPAPDILNALGILGKHHASHNQQSNGGPTGADQLPGLGLGTEVLPVEIVHNQPGRHVDGTVKGRHGSGNQGQHQDSPHALSDRHQQNGGKDLLRIDRAVEAEHPDLLNILLRPQQGLESFCQLRRIITRVVRQPGDHRPPALRRHVGMVLMDQLSRLRENGHIREEIANQEEPQHRDPHHHGPAEGHHHGPQAGHLGTFTVCLGAKVLRIADVADTMEDIAE